MLEILEYVDETGRSPFTLWFDVLDARAAATVTVALSRLATGNLASLKGVGAGVSELRIDKGPGYRVYLGREGKQLVILLGGGTKHRQQADIRAALVRWSTYKARKKSGKA